MMTPNYLDDITVKLPVKRLTKQIINFIGDHIYITVLANLVHAFGRSNL